MLVTFSADGSHPYQRVIDATREANAYANIGWVRGREVRFTLERAALNSTPATTAQHEKVILALLTLDPGATIRTSRAMYRGLVDYQRQNGQPIASPPIAPQEV